MRVARVARAALDVGFKAAGTTRDLISARTSGTLHDARGSHSVSAPGERALLLSIKPHFARAILDGRKTVELRRTRPNLPDGSLVILYSSTPKRAVVGWAKLLGVRAGTPADIWDGFGAAAAVTEHEFDLYFAGTDRAFALELDGVVCAANPISLSAIRSIGIQPPQSWRYLTADVSSQILESALA